MNLVSQSGEQFQKILDTGQTVPRDVVGAYLHELQYYNPAFNHFSSTEIVAIQNIGCARSFTRGAVIFKRGDIASCFALLLQGTAKAFTSDGNAIDETNEGEFIGHDSFFRSRMKECVYMKESVKVTATLNTLLLFSQESFGVLYKDYPLCGHRLMQLMMDLATVRARFQLESRYVRPASALCEIEIEPISLMEETKLEIRTALSIHKDNPSSLLLHDMSTSEIDTLLEYASIMRCQFGSQVFQAGIRSKFVSMLISGTLEGREIGGGGDGGGGTVRPQLGGPGDTFGEESVIPALPPAHKDTFISAQSTFLIITPETVYQLNKMEPSIAFKLTRNIVRSVLAKLKALSAPDELPCDPLELKELRRISTTGLQTALQVTKTIARAMGKEMHFEDGLQGSVALKTLLTALEKIESQANAKQKQPQADSFQVMERELQLKKTISKKDKEADQLVEKIVSLEKRNSELQLKLHLRHEEIQALKDELEDQEKSFKQKSAEVLRRSIQIRKSQSGTSDSQLVAVMKNQQLQIETLSKQLSEARAQGPVEMSTTKNDNSDDYARFNQEGESGASRHSPTEDEVFQNNKSAGKSELASFDKSPSWQKYRSVVRVKKGSKGRRAAKVSISDLQSKDHLENVKAFVSEQSILKLKGKNQENDSNSNRTVWYGNISTEDEDKDLNSTDDENGNSTDALHVEELKNMSSGHHEELWEVSDSVDERYGDHEQEQAQTLTRTLVNHQKVSETEEVPNTCSSWPTLPKIKIRRSAISTPSTPRSKRNDSVSDVSPSPRTLRTKFRAVKSFLLESESSPDPSHSPVISQNNPEGALTSYYASRMSTRRASDAGHSEYDTPLQTSPGNQTEQVRTPDEKIYTIAGRYQKRFSTLQRSASAGDIFAQGNQQHAKQKTHQGRVQRLNSVQITFEQ